VLAPAIAALALAVVAVLRRQRANERFGDLVLVREGPS
jgi:hypothetical protein